MKNILITGAGGSIGSELTIQIASASKTERIYINDIAESSLFKTLRRLDGISKDCEIIPIVGDISSSHIIEYFEDQNSIDFVFNAAAYKHVNLSNSNQISYLQNNLEATKAVIRISKSHVANLVHISTDKAVEPINIMGASKRGSEILILKEKESKSGNFKIVRFGNVLNSSGSVVPIFRDQISKGGPVTITHSNAERYFMTMEQAVNLVIQCQHVQANENILVLDMGKPILIDHIARNMIEEQGLRVATKGLPKKNEIEIVYIGLRKGEKLSEKLTYGKLKKTNVTGIFAAIEKDTGYEKVLEKINEHIETRKTLNLSGVQWY